MRPRPIVAVTADRIVRGAHPNHTAAEKYLVALVDGAGTLAFVLPALGVRQPVDAIVAAVDGLLLTGSYSNVEPHRYGGAASAPDTLHDPARDATALPLIRAAIDAGVPVLAICRGMQELNVAYGGTLHQRLHASPGFADHREREGDPLERQYGPAHRVQFTAGGLLQRVAHGARDAMVNSLHDQGLARLGAGLAVEACAPDGLIEAVSVRGARAFALGVQWHPEWRHAEQPLSRDIFAAFGAACRARMTHRLHAAGGAMPSPAASDIDID
ncbi:gamma-glutamyl-gamma-aminobutyrate hydrolase family protein [Burkholderia sp. AU19243]|uniref:gamma-glutamyl-gamma-aminobutyrate hydrolase family protein n=1 Tax=Burkholderia TaxID=32008 RepID=UPI000841A9BD|nr:MULTISPECIES: gamma-glutamyl-gamma-aminobutyrate hydrolase family protein [Burkholderia]AOK05898.1 glutamine amidotransferase [Burkholderia latens]MBR8142068.1 gamma-glutamyl-gamma-aminobutyrate hydrolase family protein [Burkholderia vietnamiensis]MBR8364895.1 gamma-glutamyl-gamma-aminobutyrate hydrolase family protein [Burkholderia sp. AU19243]MCA8308097.1 gamma-glutamyl-gamma-aminobutyrate hydrolase family protein [Burkholderia sp. AU28942]